MLRRLFLVLAACGLALLAAELGLRVLAPPDFPASPFPNADWMMVDPVFGWTNRASYRARLIEGIPESAGVVRINRLGFRGDEIEPDKPEGTLRIVCLGDSGTFGIWFGSPGGEGPRAIASLENYPDELRRQLAGRSVEVINAGVVGHSSVHGLRRLRFTLLDLEPDIVAVRYGFNDHGKRTNEAYLPFRTGSAWAGAALERLQRWRLLRLALRLHQKRSSTWGEPRVRPWVVPEDFARNLRAFAALGRRHGFRLLFLDYPLRPQAWGEQPADAQMAAVAGEASVEELYAKHRAYQQTLFQVAEAEGVPLLISRPRFERREEALFGLADLVHPSPAGSRALGRLLFARLEELGWLAPAQSAGSS